MPTAIHPVCFALGSITRKPGIKNNTTTARDHIKITILFDHDVVDGAPAARFTFRLVDLIESGYGL